MREEKDLRADLGHRFKVTSTLPLTKTVAVTLDLVEYQAQA